MIIISFFGILVSLKNSQAIIHIWLTSLDSIVPWFFFFSSITSRNIINLAWSFAVVAVLAHGLFNGAPLRVSGNLVEQKAKARPSVQMYQMWHVVSQRALSAHCWCDYGAKPNLAVDALAHSKEENISLVMIF